MASKNGPAKNSCLYKSQQASIESLQIWRQFPDFFELLQPFKNLQNLAVTLPILDLAPDQTVWPDLTFLGSIRGRKLDHLEKFLRYHPKVNQIYLEGRPAGEAAGESNDQEGPALTLSAINLLDLASYSSDKFAQFFSRVKLPNLTHLAIDMPFSLRHRGAERQATQDYLHLLVHSALKRAPNLTRMTIRMGHVNICNFANECAIAKAQALQLYPGRVLRMDADKNVGTEAADDAESTAFFW